MGAVDCAERDRARVVSIRADAMHSREHMRATAVRKMPLRRWSGVRRRLRVRVAGRCEHGAVRTRMPALVIRRALPPARTGALIRSDRGQVRGDTWAPRLNAMPKTLEQMMDRYGWDALWYPDAGHPDITSSREFFVGVWTGPDADLLCVKTCETIKAAERFLSPSAPTAIEAALASERLLRRAVTASGRDTPSRGSRNSTRRRARQTPSGGDDLLPMRRGRNSFHGS